jgi:toxin HigB-1
MIKSFKCKKTKKLWEQESVREFRAFELQARFKLSELHHARTLDDLRQTSLRLHKLTGDRQGFWSISINSQWRIVFKWDRKNAHEVSIVDYH